MQLIRTFQRPIKIAMVVTYVTVILLLVDLWR